MSAWQPSLYKGSRAELLLKYRAAGLGRVALLAGGGFALECCSILCLRRAASVATGLGRPGPALSAGRETPQSGNGEVSPQCPGGRRPPPFRGPAPEGPRPPSGRASPRRGGDNLGCNAGGSGAAGHSPAAAVLPPHQPAPHCAARTGWCCRASPAAPSLQQQAFPTCAAAGQGRVCWRRCAPRCLPLHCGPPQAPGCDGEFWPA